MKEAPFKTSAETAFNVMLALSSSGDSAFNSMVPVVESDAIIAMSFPENSFLEVPLYCS